MINIQDIIPFMEKGWVAMSAMGTWYWYETKPKLAKDCGLWLGRIGDFSVTRLSNCFDIAPADDWTKSLIRIKE